MHFHYVLFAISSCFPFFGESKSILQQNDTALELLNNCKCVLREDCYNGYLNIRGVGIIELRNKLLNESESTEVADIQCSEPSNVCCRTWKDLSANRNRSGRFLFKKEEKPVAVPLTGQKATFKVGKSKQTCGRQQPILNIRIFGAQEDIGTALNGEFPWMASIHRKSLDGAFKFRCAGSLISDAVVLTAAHCVYSSRKRPSEFKIIANARIELGKIGSSPSEERQVNKILVHPDYYSAGAQNDIALIFLDVSYSESKDLNSVCLPQESTSYDRTKCIAAGWGEGNEKNTNGEKILSKVELPLVDHDYCQELLRKTRLGRDFQLHESTICAGGEKGKDTCKGDGGGPLVCPTEEGRFVQVGVVSWGVDCSKKNQPGLYTDVEKFVDWVRDSIKQNS